MASADPENPIIACTVKQLGFAAWQESRGASSLDESGPSWERYSSWFEASRTFISIHDVVNRAWNEAQGDRRDAWWKLIVEAQPSVVSG